MARELSRVGVLGLGTMGAGIAEVLARSGLQVVGVELGPDALDRGRSHVERSTERAVSRGKLAAGERDAILDRLSFRTGLDALADVELVVEAVPERLDMKRSLFAQLDRICSPEAILATNTSSLPVIDIAMATDRPARVLGMHWFNPAPVMGLVEVVGTVRTDRTVLDDVVALAIRAGKTAVRVGDRAGFIANALLFGYLNAAVTLYESRVASREDIDAAMKIGAGFPMGPLTLLDLIGLDTAFEILETMYGSTRDRLHAPAPILRQLVAAGLLGRKTGRGFYAYAGPDESQPSAEVVGPRPVRRVGVVGAGWPADDIAVALTAADYDVHAIDAADDLVSLFDRELVVVAAEAPLAPARLDSALGPDSVLAVVAPAGTPVLLLPAPTDRLADVVGLRWHDTPLVEVAATVATAPEAAAAVRTVFGRTGRTVIACRDRAGLVVDALLFPHLNDAVRMLESGYASVADIDAAMKLGCGYPAGPFELLDRIGPEVALLAQSAIYRVTPEPGLAPVPLLEQVAITGRSFSDPAGGCG